MVVVSSREDGDHAGGSQLDSRAVHVTPICIGLGAAFIQPLSLEERGWSQFNAMRQQPAIL